MVDDLGLLGTGESADAILDGCYKTPEGTDQYIQTVINQLKCPDKHILKK